MVAVGGQGVGAGIDKTRLRLAHLAVHRGEQQRHQGEGVHKPAALAASPLQVRLDQTAEEIGQRKAGEVRHGGGQLPIQGGGHRVPLGIQGVVILHVEGGEPLVGVPHAAGALAHEAVGLPAEGHPGGGVGDLAAEGGHPFIVLFVDGGGGHGLRHGGTLLLYMCPGWAGVWIC